MLEENKGAKREWGEKILKRKKREIKTSVSSNVTIIAQRRDLFFPFSRMEGKKRTRKGKRMKRTLSKPWYNIKEDIVFRVFFCVAVQRP